MQAAQDRYNRGKVYHAGAPDRSVEGLPVDAARRPSSQSATGQSTSATPAVAVKGPGASNGTP